QSLAQATAQIRQTLTSQQQTNAQTAIDNRAKKDWLTQTTCRSQYAMADCKGYKAPKTSTTGAAGAGAAGSGSAGAAGSGAAGSGAAGSGAAGSSSGG
ncbi:MAG TPA: hypothetical protein VH208_02300, partial [Myxococcaceae bacterium]|nr:hypothetical protein [Myxococcaceae bacterium]